MTTAPDCCRSGRPHQHLDPAGAAAIPAPTSSLPPPPPAPAAGIPRPPLQMDRVDRRRGIVIIPESDIAALVKLEPGQRIAGMRDDPMRQSFMVLVEGAGIPACHEFADPPYLNGMRWATPPPRPLNLLDWPAMAPLELHALVLLQLRTAVDLDPIPGTAWAAAEAIVRRHAPIKVGDRWWCARCCTACLTDDDDPDVPGHWRCADYVDAAGLVVIGLGVGAHV